MKDKLKGLDLTPEERRGVEKYKAWIDAKRIATRMAPFYAEIDRQYPELSPEVRQELADSMYAKEQAEYALRRSQPKA